VIETRDDLPAADWKEIARQVAAHGRTLRFEYNYNARDLSDLYDGIPLSARRWPAMLTRTIPRPSRTSTEITRLRVHHNVAIVEVDEETASRRERVITAVDVGKTSTPEDRRQIEGSIVMGSAMPRGEIRDPKRDTRHDN